MSQPLNTYAQAEAWLLSVIDYERLLGSGNVRYDTTNFDLEHFQSQMADLGSPQLAFGAIHVAGTKGKGSTCAFMEAALRRCGLRTGLYTSPHLTRFTERIRVNGEMIPDSEFCRLLEVTGSRVLPPDSDPGSDDRSFRTVFELLTATAFLYFAEQKVDVAIIETGLGGRLDSTNVFYKPGAGPLINVITAIGLDHTAILGNTLEAIATEKAGIIRPHAQVVVAEQISPHTEVIVREVISDKCLQMDAAKPLFVGDAVTMEIAPQADGTMCWHFRSSHDDTESSGDRPLTKALADGQTICPALEGEHQARNVATALVALIAYEKAAADRLPKGLSPEAVRVGLETADWPGRFQVIESKVPVVIDGAHCPLSAQALAVACKARFGNRPAVIITGFLKDKAGRELLDRLVSQIPVAHAIALAAPTPRSVPLSDIKNELENVLGAERVTAAESLQQAVPLAIEQASQTDGYIIIFGSLYHIGPALDYFKEQ